MDLYLRTSDGGLWGLSTPNMQQLIMSQARKDPSRRSEHPESTVLHSGIQPNHGDSLRQDKTRRMCKQELQHMHLVKTRHAAYAFSQWKHNFVLFSPMPFRSMNTARHPTLLNWMIYEVEKLTTIEHVD